MTEPKPTLDYARRQPRRQPWRELSARQGVVEACTVFGFLAYIAFAICVLVAFVFTWPRRFLP